ncbi:MAG: UDP-N-acetylmuramoyl-L-alanyl-D-glutamate--2,6-diaminopimelate ligase [Gemmatimonadetes bacterium]|nr:UDP-N-acetylmuramoyl-L-alanyl-D-glutamate--2,6-diaminopimelate ligase [Gemmatimonadota bacterium]
MRAEELRERLARTGQLVRWPDGVPPEIRAVTTDSRRVERGALFVAYAGSSGDGHAYLAAAEQAGAGCAITERPVADLGIPHIEVRDGRRAAGLAASLLCGDPAGALELLAVTGTNGKTTTVHLLRRLFGDRAPAGSLGTLGLIDGEGRVVPTAGSLTTPGPVELQAALAALRDAGVKTVAMEASSHSLDQDRIAGLEFRAAVFTNLTREHLDYHPDEAAYLAAKLKLAAYVAEGGFAIANADDPAWHNLPAPPERLTFGIAAAADVRGSDIVGDESGMRFTLAAGGRSAKVALPLLGRANVENALGAAAAAIALGREVADVADRLRDTPQVPGRMERLTDAPCVVLRDYAHTPVAMERALATVRALTKGRLFVLFGCGGDRDRGKRPLMGAIAARDADITLLTADNPRTENVERILDDIEEGMGATPHLRIVDRRAAIARALSMARAEDTILLVGKGHETYQVVGSEKLPFDERAIVAELVRGSAR